MHYNKIKNLTDLFKTFGCIGPDVKKDVSEAIYAASKSGITTTYLDDGITLTSIDDDGYESQETLLYPFNAWDLSNTIDKLDRVKV